MLILLPLPARAELAAENGSFYTTKISAYVRVGTCVHLLLLLYTPHTLTPQSEMSVNRHSSQLAASAGVSASQRTPFPRLPQGWPRAGRCVVRWLDETCLPQCVCALWEGWRVRDKCVVYSMCVRESLYYVLSSSRWHTDKSKAHTSFCGTVAE